MKIMFDTIYLMIASAIRLLFNNSIGNNKCLRRWSTNVI
jgi:hypothetical protein